MDHSGNDVPKRESEISVLAEVGAVRGERIGNMNAGGGRPFLGPRQRDLRCQTRTLAALEEP